MSNDLTIASKSTGIALLNKPLAPLTPALKTADQCRRLMQSSSLPSIPRHDACFVDRAIQVRNQLLPDAARARAAYHLLFPIAVFVDEGAVDASTALAMLSVLFATMTKKKPNDESLAMKLASCADMFDPISDSIGASTGLWESVPRHPVFIALAIKQLIATKVFEPSPSELREACCLARQKLAVACGYVEQWLARLDAAEEILLEFAPKEWASAYRSNADRLAALEVVRFGLDKDDLSDELAAIEAKIEPPTPKPQKKLSPKRKAKTQAEAATINNNKVDAATNAPP